MENDWSRKQVGALKQELAELHKKLRKKRQLIATAWHRTEGSQYSSRRWRTVLAN